MDYLIIYKTNCNKVRLGSLTDGGYIISENTPVNLLLSAGIENNIDFEDEFTKKYNVNAICFDGTITGLPHYNNKQITHIKKNIGPYENDEISNMHKLIDEYNNIFLKMDIECSEYKWLKTLSREQLNKFSQIVIEFHFPFAPVDHGILMMYNEDTSVPDKIQLLELLAETHVLIHLHPNNVCGLTQYNGIIVPNIFECTYVRKDLCEIIERSTSIIPDPLLDYKNRDYYEDIILDSYPFCNKR